jgi:acetyl esterase/lipase
MHRFLFFSVACLLFLAVNAASLTFADTPATQRADPSILSDETAFPAAAIAHRDLSYVVRATGAGKLDLFIPPGPGPFPLVIWIHGGAWKLGDKAAWSHMNFLLDEGFAVANVEYRFSQVAPFPAQLNDCTAALDFLAAHAAEYHLDAQRIAATGESAGGHLAALLGMTRSASKPPASKGPSEGRIRAVIELAGPTDLTTLQDSSPTLKREQVVEQLLGGSLQTHRDLAIAASPLLQVAKTAPPFLILHGTADPLVPFAQSRRLADALAAAGVPVDLVSVQGAGHGGPAFWTDAMRKKIIAFLSHP